MLRWQSFRNTFWSAHTKYGVWHIERFDNFYAVQLNIDPIGTSSGARQNMGTYSTLERAKLIAQKDHDIIKKSFGRSKVRRHKKAGR